MYDPQWSSAPSETPGSNSNTVTVSAATGESKAIALYMNRGDWSGGKRYIYVTAGDSSATNRVARIEVDAHMYDPEWASDPSETPGGNSNTVTVSAATGESKAIALYMNRGEWSNGARDIYVTAGDSADNHRVAKINVEIPNPTNLSSITTYGNTPPSGGHGFGNISKSGITAGKYMSMTARFGGKNFTFYFLVVA